MKTIQEKYNAVLEGKFSKTQFVRDAKRELSQFLSPYNGFNDSVSILKTKGVLTEAKEETLEYDCPVSEYSEEDLRRGCDYELAKKGIDPVDASKEDREACEKVAIKNLEKDRMHYLNILAGESDKVDKHDKMIDVKKGNEVDTFNGMKKATLKESIGDPSKLEKGDEDPDNPFGMITRIVKGKNGYEILGKEDGEGYYYFVDFDGNEMDEDDFIYEEEVKENMYIDDDEFEDEMIKAEFPRVKAALVKDDNPYATDDDMIYDFIKTHREDFPSHYDPKYDESVAREFDEFFAANFEMGSDLIDEKEAKSVEDVVDPHDYVEIGQGYLKGFKRPHSLKDADLETLGRKVVKVLFRGNLDKAKAKLVKEQMSDKEMEDIKNYGQEEKETKVYQPGDKWSKDFDYDGMLKAGLKIKISTPLAKMQQIYDSFEDVNYHRENGHLGNAMDYVEDGDKAGALQHLKLYRDSIRKTLSDISEGKCNTHREKNEEVVTESRGAFDMCVSAIQDIAEDGDISEREAAMEMMIAIADKYDFDIAGLESQLFHGDDSINEGRRRKSQGGKVVTEMDYDTGGYVENMGPIFEKAVNMLINAWEEWKMGPMTEPGMIEFAKKDVLDYLETQLMVQNLEEKKGKDHDGDGDVDSDDYMAAKDKAIKKAMGKEKVVKENIKAIITKVLEEGVINEAATNALAEFSQTYGGFEGMKQAIIALEDIVTDIESYYDKTRGKIQKVYDTLGDIRNEEGLKVGGFLAPAIEQAFNKDLRPAIKGGFTKGLDQPKVKMLTQRDIDMHNSGEKPLGEEEKQTVYSRPAVNGTLQETKKNKK